jgi:WD40 repeat protein
MAFLSDGKTLLSAGDSPLRAWEVASGKEVPPPVSLPGKISTFALSANRRLLAAVSDDAMLRIGDLQTGRIVARWSLGKGHSSAIAFSPDGRLVAWADASHQIHLRDLSTQRDTRLLKGHVDSVLRLAFAPDGKGLVSHSQADGIFQWSTGTGKRLRRFGQNRERNTVTDICFGRDGRTLLAGGIEGLLIRYETDSIEEQFKIATDQMITVLALSPDGKTVASGGATGDVRLWNPATGKAVKAFIPAGPGVSVASLAFTANGKTLAAGGTNGVIRLWDVASGKELVGRDGGERIVAADFSTDGREVITVQEGRLAHWSAESAKRLRSFKLTGGPLITAVLSPDRKLLALARAEKSVSVLDARKGSDIATIGGGAALPFIAARMAFTPDSRWLAATSGEDPREVRIWTAGTGKEVFSLQVEGNEFVAGSLVISADGRTLFSPGADSASLVRWELCSGKRRQPFRLPTAVGSAPGGHLAFLVGRRGRMLVHRSGPPLITALSPDGRSVLLSRGEVLYLCDLRTGGVLRFFSGPRQPLNTVAFSPDGKLLAAGGEDHLVRLWDVATGTPRATLAGHRGNVTHLSFNASGQRFLSASVDGTVLVWDVATALRQPPPRPAATRPLEVLWEELASEDAVVAEKAQRELEDSPARALPFLARQVRPVAAVPAARLAKLIADLDSTNNRERDRASEQLKQLDELALPALRKAAASASAEVRKRAERLLEPLERPLLTGAQARPIRVVELLERLGTVPARKLLGELAGGAPDARLTQEATSAVQRLRGR